MGTTWRASLRSLRPGALAALGVVAGGLPIRLMVGSGFLTGASIGLAGLVGAVVFLAVGDRGTFGEVFGLARKAISHK